MVTANGSFTHHNSTSCFWTEKVIAILEDAINKCNKGITMLKHEETPEQVNFFLSWGVEMDEEEFKTRKDVLVKMLNYVSKSENQMYYVCHHRRGGYLQILKMCEVTYIRQRVDIGETS